MSTDRIDLDFDPDASDLMRSPTWAGQDVTIDQVLNAVEELRHRDMRATNRTSVATVVMVARNENDQKAIDAVLEHLRPRHPARVITVYMDADAMDRPDNITASVALLSGNAQGHDVWSDEIHLRPTGGPAHHRASMLRPLLLADLPVVVWWVGALPDFGDPLLKLADTVIVDSRKAIEYDSEPISAIARVFDQIALLSRKNVVADLSWVRIQMWRQVLAGQFNGAVYRPFLQNIDSVVVSGKSSPVTLLSGWLASRLRLDRSQVEMKEDRHIRIEINCSHDGKKAQVLVEREGDNPLIHASARIEDGPSHTELVAMPEIGVTGALLLVLRRLERDRVYEQSIRLVAGWLD